MEKMKRILIKNGSVWDGFSIKKRDILICDGYIERVSRDIEGNADFLFEAENMLVSSGLCDFHTHIRDISPDSIGIDSEKISHPFGVTHLVDASAETGDIGSTGKANTDISVLARVFIEDNRASLGFTEKIIEKYRDKVIGLKVYFDRGISEVRDEYPIREICEFARKRDLFVAVHTGNSPISMKRLVGALDRGDVIAHIFHGGVNNSSEEDFECLSLARERGVLTDAAFSVGYHIDFSIFKAAVERGFSPDIISTDITRGQEYIGNEKYGLALCMSVAEKCGMKQEEVFMAVTNTPSALQRNAPVGEGLRVGDRADIALLTKVPCDVKIPDRFGNEVYLDEAYKCTLCVVGDTVFK